MASGPANQPDDYLTAIWLLTSPIGERTAGRRQPTAPARIAELLGVSRASVGEMLTKLEERQLVERGERKEALLTATGRAEAMRAVRKHRLVSTFLVEQLGYPLWEVHTHVGALVDGFGDDAIERLYVFLGSPERSPHGFPIDADHELRENASLTLASRAPHGTVAEVVRITERDPALQQWLAERQLVPGSAVTVSNTGTTMTLQGARGTCELDEAAARGVYLRPDGVPPVPATASCWADILLRERALSAGSA